MNRLTIYAFYDPAGVVDDYVVDCVVAMAQHSEKVLVVSNGRVEAASRHRLADLPGVQVVERTNNGFDIWGYKYGLDFLGWRELDRYDEVVLTNSTTAGPLYPLSEMFCTMDARDVDFWGMTMHAGEDYDPWGSLVPTGLLEPHIQSYFMAVRRQMLPSRAFRDYWNRLPPIRSYTDAVVLHEVMFTRRFEELGFRWSTYVDGSDLAEITAYPLMYLPQQTLIGNRCPFFKRKALFLPAADMALTQAASTATMLACLDDLRYDLRRVLPSVIRTSHQADVRVAMSAFTTLTPRSPDETLDLSSVRVVAWINDLLTCTALDRCRTTLEQCGEIVIFTGADTEDRLSERLSGFKARVTNGTNYSQFVREVGRHAQTRGYLLVLGGTGDSTRCPEISAYTQYETGLRALAGTPAILGSAMSYLENSSYAGALASPVGALTLGVQQALWSDLAASVESQLTMLGIRVPVAPEKPAWGPPSGILLAAPGTLATDWNRIADNMSELDETKAEKLFTSLTPFVLQSHNRLLMFALPETMTGSALFASHLTSLLAGHHAIPPSIRKGRALVARTYHSGRRVSRRIGKRLVATARTHQHQSRP